MLNLKYLISRVIPYLSTIRFSNNRQFQSIAFVYLIVIGTSFADEKRQGRIILEDGFEQFEKILTQEGPPNGWSIWGKESVKDRPNFIIDTKNAHSGEASFRIHHLAESTSFTVLDTKRAIRPEKGGAYTISFWAKSDEDTEIFFGINAYNSLQPKIDRAFSPDYRPIHVNPKWTRFSFTFNEGLHFFVTGQSPHLLLTFLSKLTRGTDEEKTFWLDDILVSESKTPVLSPPTDTSVTSSAGLHHAMKPGKEVIFNVDVTRRIRPCYREIAGISFWRLQHPVSGPFNAKGHYSLNSKIEQSIRDLHLPMSRLFGVGDETSPGNISGEPWSIEHSIDRAATLCRKVGAPQEWFFLELENPEAHTSLPPETWARAVNYVKKKGYSFQYWEVSNEPYANAVLGRQPMAFPKPEDYLQHFLKVSRSIHESDPQAQVGLSIVKNNPMWSSYLLREAAGSYDFVVPHLYTFPESTMSKADFTSVVLTANAKTLNSALELNARIRHYNPERTIPILDTEWGLHGFDLNADAPGLVARNSNIWAGIHDAVRLIYYAREGIVRGASAWSMLSSDRQQPGLKFLFTDAPEQLTLRYWLYYHFGRNLGDRVVKIDGTSPFFPSGNALEAFAMPVTPAVATISDDGKKLFFIVANGTWDEELDCNLQLQEFQPKNVTAVLFSDFRKNASVAHPLLKQKEEAMRNLDFQITQKNLQFKLPGHSVAFIQMENELD